MGRLSPARKRSTCASSLSTSATFIQGFLRYLRTSAADMPSQVAGILYADVQNLTPLLEKLQASSSKSSGSTSKPMSPEVKRNLKALGSLLLYGSVNGDVVTAKGFVSVR